MSAEPAWATVSAATIGSAHVQHGLPLQDAVLTWADGDQAVVAVADGHGHHAHFRSDTGAALAVVSVVEELRRVLDRLTDPETAAGLAREALDATVRTWTDKVRHHADAHPFTGEELELGAAVDVRRPYGSTLIAVAVSGDVMVVAQIGDGDAVVVDSRGEAFSPLPDDPRHDGVHTSSLCQRDPMDSLRLAVIDTRMEDLALAFVCSDGFGNARVEADWRQRTGRQLREYAGARGPGWIGEQLPGWLAEPADVGGDDTTMALLIRR